MCTDTEQCDDGLNPITRAVVGLHGPEMERSLDRFIDHMRKIIPDFAKDAERDMLLVVFAAGRTDAIEYVRKHTEVLYEASNGLTAMALSHYSEGRGIDVDTMNANLDRANAEAQQLRKETAP